MKTRVNFYSTAAFDVDCQNGFTETCPNELPVDGALNILEGCIDNHRFAKFKIMSKDAHPINACWNTDDDNPILSPVGFPDVDIHWPMHCVVGTDGFELMKGLPHPSEYDFLVYKGVEIDMHPYSPIYHDLRKRISTGVIEWAMVRGIDTFILGGLALNYCVGEAAKDLQAAGFNVIVNLAATRGIGDCTEYIKKLEELGVKIINNTNELDLVK